MQSWLKQHGHQNVFTFFSEEQCRTLLQNLEAQLKTEEQLELAAREVVAFSHLSTHNPEPEQTLSPLGTNSWDSNRVNTRLTPSGSTGTPHSLLSTLHSPLSILHSLLRRFALVAGVLVVLVVWSFGLYRYAYQQGRKVPASVAQVCYAPEQPKSIAQIPAFCTSAGCKTRMSQHSSTTLLTSSVAMGFPTTTSSIPAWSEFVALPSPFSPSASQVSLPAHPRKTRITGSLEWHSPHPPLFPQQLAWPEGWQDNHTLLTANTLQLSLRQQADDTALSRFLLLRPLQISN